MRPLTRPRKSVQELETVHLGRRIVATVAVELSRRKLRDPENHRSAEVYLTLLGVLAFEAIAMLGFGPAAVTRPAAAK